MKALDKCILGMNCFFRLETIQKKSLTLLIFTPRHLRPTLHGTEQETKVRSQGCDYLTRALFCFFSSLWSVCWNDAMAPFFRQDLRLFLDWTAEPPFPLLRS